jgi:hypothetical protein
VQLQLQWQVELLAEADAQRARVNCVEDDERCDGVGAGVVDVELAGALGDACGARRSGRAPQNGAAAGRAARRGRRAARPR